MADQEQTTKQPCQPQADQRASDSDAKFCSRGFRLAADLRYAAENEQRDAFHRDVIPQGNQCVPQFVQQN